MNEDINEVTLLSKEQVFGDNKLDIFSKVGTKCAVTDFAILLGANVSNNYRVSDDSSLRGRTTWWYLSSSDGAGDVCYVGAAGARNWTFAGVRSCAVRPALLLSSISKNSLIGTEKGGTIEVTYGEYPQYVVDTSLGKTLDSEFSAGRLRKTGKTYTTDSRHWNARSGKFYPVKHEEFEYNGKRYVRVKSNDTDENFKLTNGTTAHPGDYFWLEVSPITWLVDENSRMLVSKTLLAAGIRFCDDGKYSDNFKETEMYMFLNKYFIKDIIPSMNVEDEIKAEYTDSIGNQIDQLYDEIVKLNEQYLGKKDFIKEAKSLLDKYNENLEEIRKGKDPSLYTIKLTKKNLDPDYLFEKIKIDLNNIINEFKEYYEKYKNHIKMLDYTRKCISILNKKDDDVSEVFFDDLVKIRDIVTPYISGNSILENIKELFKDYEIELINCLKEEDSKVSEIKTLEDFKKDIALHMTPFLVELDKEVRSNDILNDIVERYKSLSETIEKQDRNEHIKFWFDQIENCVKEIKRIGNNNDRYNLDKLLKNNDFISDKVDASINKVYTLYMNLYRILLDINDRNEFYNDIDSRRSSR